VPFRHGYPAVRLTGSAWLYDIGYAPELVETGFHPLGLSRQRLPSRVTYTLKMSRKASSPARTP